MSNGFSTNRQGRFARALFLDFTAIGNVNQDKNQNPLKDQGKMVQAEGGQQQDGPVKKEGRAGDNVPRANPQEEKRADSGADCKVKNEAPDRGGLERPARHPKPKQDIREQQPEYRPPAGCVPHPSSPFVGRRWEFGMESPKSIPVANGTNRWGRERKFRLKKRGICPAFGTTGQQGRA
jgi:hypothetical protein